MIMFLLKKNEILEYGDMGWDLGYEKNQLVSLLLTNHSVSIICRVR